MPGETMLEERVSALEQAVAELQRQLMNGSSGLDLLKRIPTGLKDNPAFEEAMAHGRALRWADRPGEEEGKK